MRKNFFRDTAGQVGVVFAVSALPIMVGSTLAIDKHNSNTMHSDLQDAVDGAVLATVSNGALQPGERQTYAEARFHSNFPDIPAQLQFSDEDGVVRMTATAQMPTTMGSIIGKDNYTLSATAAGVVNRGKTICVLALAEDSESALSFTDSVLFDANNCSVHVNSTHANAITSASTMTPKAQDFCVTGGGEGNFSPPLNSECNPVKDPYAELVLPEPAACIEDAAVRSDQFFSSLRSGELQMGTTYRAAPSDAPSEDSARSVSNTTLMPGTYCDPVIVDGANVTFSPGTYQFLSGLKFENSAEAYARDVTIVLRGANTIIEVETGAQVYLKAPSHGDLAGLAIVQDDKAFVGLGSQVVQAPAWLQNFIGGDATSKLKSGGYLDVIGTVYLPDQHLDVSGTSTFGARARSTSFIAHSVSFTENTRVTLSVNHQAEGLPPIEPRIDEAPRLIQ